MTAPRVVLVGPMGAGKTTVGRLLAERWGVPFRDTDDVVEQTEGRTVSDIFVDSGEEHFRALERAAVAEALGEHRRGAGARRWSRDRSEETRARWPDTRSSSCGSGSPTPRRGSASARRDRCCSATCAARMKALLDERTPVYESVATGTVDTDGRTPDEVADLVEEVLGG